MLKLDKERKKEHKNDNLVVSATCNSNIFEMKKWKRKNHIEIVVYVVGNPLNDVMKVDVVNEWLMSHLCRCV